MKSLRRTFLESRVWENHKHGLMRRFWKRARRHREARLDLTL